MAVLKKLVASTLMETLVATVLIVVVFMMASMTLNSLFENTMARNDNEIQQELLYLMYRHENGKLPLPHYGEIGPWNIEVEPIDNTSNTVVFSAVHEVNDKKVSIAISKE